MTPDNSNRLPINRKLLTRLFSKIKVSTTHFYKGDPCWEWQGYRDKNGYGTSSLGRNRIYRAHRLIYNLFVEIVPPELECDHLCRHTCCVNPAHIEPVAPPEHRLRTVQSRAQDRTHCKHGHLLTPDNLVVRKFTNRRDCRTCAKEWGRAAYRQKLAAQGKSPVPHAERTHCPKGHPYEGDNLLMRNNTRICRTCQNYATRRYHKGKRQRMNALPDNDPVKIAWKAHNHAVDKARYYAKPRSRRNSKRSIEKSNQVST